MTNEPRVSNPCPNCVGIGVIYVRGSIHLCDPCRVCGGTGRSSDAPRSHTFRFDTPNCTECGEPSWSADGACPGKRSNEVTTTKFEQMAADVGELPTGLLAVGQLANEAQHTCSPEGGTKSYIACLACQAQGRAAQRTQEAPPERPADRLATESATPTGRRQEVIEQLCKMMGRAWSTIDPNAHNPCDCICRDLGSLRYQNSGEALTFLEEALSDAIAKRNGKALDYPRRIWVVLVRDIDKPQPPRCFRTSEEAFAHYDEAVKAPHTTATVYSTELGSAPRSDSGPKDGDQR